MRRVGNYEYMHVRTRRYNFLDPESYLSFGLKHNDNNNRSPIS